MEISIYHKAFNVILSPMARILLATGVLLSACADSEQAPSPVPEHTATLQLVFKQQGSADGSSPTQLKGTGSFATDAPLTVYAETDAPLTMDAAMPASRGPMTRAVNETDIQTVDVLSFKVNPLDPTNIKEGTFFYRSIGTYTQTSPGQGKVEVKLVDSPEAQTLVVLANVRTQVDALDATYGEQKEAVMARLLLPATADGTPDFAKGMPMWGELLNEVVGEGFSPSGAPKEVTMIRSVVKFTYREKTSQLYSPAGINLWYNGLHFEAYNFRSKGRVAPDNFRPASLSVATPTVPAGATQAQGTHHTLSSYVPLTYDGTGGEVSFYMFESDNSKANTGSALDATCLVVHFLGGPATGWHRLDFRDYAQPAGTGFMDLLRGHHYVIEPEEWDGTGGALTAEEAFKGVSKIKCRIVPWNEVQEEVKVPGNKRLTVDKREVYIPFSAATTGRPLTITTENTGGWTTADVPAWCTLSNTQTTTDGTVVLNITTNKLYARGSFKLKAGAAEMEIKVKVGKLPPEYMSEYNLAGGSAYGYIPGTGATAAQTDGPLRWANDNQFGASGYYNWYVCTGTTDATHNPNGLKLFEDPLLKDKYHLPSAEEWGGILPPHGFISWNSYTELTINERLRHEKINIGGQKHTYKSEYKLLSPWKMSALRFQKGVQGANAEYPLAPDNSMVCAYFYELKSVQYPGGSWGSAVNIRIVYLGGDAAIPTINQLTLAWWQAQEQIPGRVFNYTIERSGYLSPLSGNPSSGIPGGTIPGSVSQLNTAFNFWTSSPPPPGTSQAWRYGYTAFENGHAIGEAHQPKYRGYSVRPFHNYDE